MDVFEPVLTIPEILVWPKFNSGHVCGINFKFDERHFSAGCQKLKY